MTKPAPVSGVTYRTGANHDCRPEWSWSPQNMADFDLWLVTGGTGELTFANGKHFQLHRGVCFLFAPGDSLTARHNPKEPLKVLAIHFVCQDQTRQAMASEIAAMQQLKLASPSLIETMMQRSIQAGQLNNRHDAEIWLEATLMELHAEALKANHLSAPLYNRINQLCTMMLAHPQKNWDVRQLARQCHLCPDHFIRVFQKQIGMTPKTFIIHNRIELACNLLLRSDMRIAEIAEASGCGNSHYFSRLFKKQTGNSPSDYRALRLKHTTPA